MTSRARSEAEKSRRRAEILSVTKTLFEDRPYEELSLSVIADNLSFSRAALYTYFNSREAIFLTLLQEEYTSLFDDLKALLSDDGFKLQSFASVLAGQFIRRTTFLRLQALLHVVLEKNLEKDDIRIFKQSLLAQFDAAAGQFKQQLPYLSSEAADQLLFDILATVVGYYQIATPAPLVAEVLNEPEFNRLKIDFEPALLRAFTSLFNQL